MTQPIRDDAGDDAADESRRGGALLDPLDAYMRGIARRPMLPHEEILRLARQRGEHEAAFARAMAAMPPSAVELLRRWHELRNAERVTGLLGRGYRDDDGRDWTAHIDACMQRVEELLSRAASAQRTRRLAETVREAEIGFETLLDVHRLFEARLPQPRLQREHFRAAAQALAQRSEALRRIVEHNLRLVVSVVKRYRSMGIPLLDLIQEGNLGLIRAAEKFDPELGYRFSTYAVWWIEQSAVRAIQNHSRTVRTPSHLYDAQLRYKRAAHTFRVLHGREPSEQELVETLGLKPAEVMAVLSIGRPIASLQEPASEGEALTLEDGLEDAAAPDPIATIDRAELRGQAGLLLEVLNPRQRFVVEKRFGLAGEPPLALAEIGAQMGLSRERVRQIQATALERMRGLDAARRLEASVRG